jgi:hypothetical protein
MDGMRAAPICCAAAGGLGARMPHPGTVVTEAIVLEYGRDELLRRLFGRATKGD